MWYILDKAFVGTPFASVADSLENLRRRGRIRKVLRETVTDPSKWREERKLITKIFRNVPAVQESLYKKKNHKVLKEYIQRFLEEQAESLCKDDKGKDDEALKKYIQRFLEKHASD